MSRDEKHLKPASTAITAGRAASGSSLAPALWGSSVWQSTGMDDCWIAPAERAFRTYSGAPGFVSEVATLASVKTELRFEEDARGRGS